MILRPDSAVFHIFFSLVDLDGVCLDLPGSFIVHKQYVLMSHAECTEILQYEYSGFVLCAECKEIP